MNRYVRITFGLLLISVLLLAGCGHKITAEEIIAKMQETLDSTEDAHAIVSVDVNLNGNHVLVTAEVWEKSLNRFRAEVLEANQPDLVGMTIVVNDQQGWFYDPAHNQVMIGAPDDLDTPLPQAVLTEMQDVIQEVMDLCDAELDGEETVAGQNAYKLILTPKEDAERNIFPGNGVATLWVDEEQWMILKANYEASAFGVGTIQVTTFELNPGLPDSFFTFDVPEGVEVVDAESQQPVPLTLEEARAQAGFHLLVPTYVPEGSTLIEVFQVGDSYVLRYDHSPTASFALVQGSELGELSPIETQLATMTADTQDITVRGQAAKAFSDLAGGNTLLYWSEDGVVITIAGHISLDQAVEIAESLR